MLVWVEPYGVPVEVLPGESLQVGFTCDPSEVRFTAFGSYHYLSLPAGCQPKLTLEGSGKATSVDLSKFGHKTITVDAKSFGLQRMIEHLATSIISTNEHQIGCDCAEALSMIGSIEAIDALFCAYDDAQQGLVESLRPRIIYWLNLCKFDTPQKRILGLKYLEFLRGLIANAPNTPADSCRRAFYLLSKLREQSSETMDLIVSLIERIAGTSDHEWKVTLDAAILFVEKRAKGLIRRNAELRVALRNTKVLDPMHYCLVCDYYFSSRKEFGDICPDCKFEFGIDNDAHYRRD